MRTTRSLSLTQAGEQLYPHDAGQLSGPGCGLATLAHFRDTPSGTVRINASQHAIDKVLLPKLALFRQRYPDIRLELISENRFVNIIDERFDAGVRLGARWTRNGGRAHHPDMEMVMVATPDHLLQYGFPQAPADLAGTPASPTSLPMAASIRGSCGRRASPSGTGPGGSGSSPTATWRRRRQEGAGAGLCAGGAGHR